MSQLVYISFSKKLPTTSHATFRMCIRLLLLHRTVLVRTRKQHVFDTFRQSYILFISFVMMRMLHITFSVLGCSIQAMQWGGLSPNSRKVLGLIPNQGLLNINKNSKVSSVPLTSPSVSVDVPALSSSGRVSPGPPTLFLLLFSLSAL